VRRAPGHLAGQRGPVLGATPLPPEALRTAGLGEMQRIIREQEPPKPSTRVSSASVSSKEAARHRRCDPRSLVRLLRGDVDWIVMKALEKDRTRRYATAADLARDIERHLADEPVEAGPPSRVYRLRKLARRNRAAVLAGSATASALVVGLVLATLGLLRARHEAVGTRAVADFYERMLTSLVPYHPGTAQADYAPPGPAGFTELTVADLLSRSEPAIETTFAARPDLEAGVRRTFGWTFAGLGRGEEAVRLLRRSLEVQRATLGQAHPESLRTVSLLAFASYLNGSPKEAAETVRASLDARAAGLGRKHAATLDNQRFVATMLLSCGELEDAERLAADVVERGTRALGRDHGVVLWARHAAATVARDRGRLEEALPLFEEVQSAATAALPSNPLQALVPLELGVALTELGRLDEAEEQIVAAIEYTTRVFGERHPFVPALRAIAARIEAERGDLAGAEALLRGITAAQRERLGPGHFLTAKSEGLLIDVLIASGQLAEAEERARRLPAAQRKAFGEGGTRYVVARWRLGRVLLEEGRFEEAADHMAALLRDAERLLPGGFLEMPSMRATYGRALSALGRLDEARTELISAHEAMAAMRGEEHPKARACAAALAALDDARGDAEQTSARR